VYYQLVSLQYIAKTELEYTQTTCRLLKRMRLDGTIPFSWIADNTRWQRKPKSFSSLEEAMENCAAIYRRSVWDDQDVYVEIWTEKDALAGVLIEETRKWDVPLMVSRGFSSLTFIHDSAEYIKDLGKPAYLYYFGDHDPSGLLVDKNIEKWLRYFAPDAEIHFERVAVTRRQIRELKLPTRPTKPSSHNKSFVGNSVEVDAIPPNILRGLVRDCIEQHVDRRKYEVLKVAEKSEREALKILKDLDLQKLARSESREVGEEEE
jgi:hypothetical protein